MFLPWTWMFSSQGSKYYSKYIKKEKKEIKSLKKMVSKSLLADVMYHSISALIDFEALGI